MHPRDAIAGTRWGEWEIRGPVHLFRERLLLRLFMTAMPFPGRVLDAGCGSGTLAVDLCRAGYQAVGVEDAPEFVDMVRIRAQRLGLQRNLAVHRGSVTRTNLAAGSFDGIVCGEVLEHVLPDEGGDEAALAEFDRLLRPGGICAISVPLGPGQWDHTDDWARHVKRYARDELQELLHAAGFEVQQVRYWGFPLGMIYHRCLFAPWVRRVAGQSVAECEARPDTRVGRHPLLVHALASILRFDEIFGRWPWGRGVMAVAKRPE